MFLYYESIFNHLYLRIHEHSVLEVKENTSV